jgi:hypothetical protein
MPPTFVLPKRSLIELEYGKSINLTCQANGLPKPRVRWIEGVCFCFSSYLNHSLLMLPFLFLLNILSYRRF